jgi:hypothetical protein
VSTNSLSPFLSGGFFWATYAGAELDLLLLHRGRRHGFEFKLGEIPSITRSMRMAMADLGLARLWVIAPAKERYELDRHIAVCPLAEWHASLLDE